MFFLNSLGQAARRLGGTASGVSPLFPSVSTMVTPSSRVYQTLVLAARAMQHTTERAATGPDLRHNTLISPDQELIKPGILELA
jgi:hypothetical protein